MKPKDWIIILLVFFIVICLCLMGAFWYCFKVLNLNSYVIGFLATDQHQLDSKYDGTPDGEFNKKISYYIKSDDNRKRYVLNLIRNLEFNNAHKWWLFETMYHVLTDEEKVTLCLELIEKYYDPEYDCRKVSFEQNDLRWSRLITLFGGLDLVDRTKLIPYLKKVLSNENEFSLMKVTAIGNLPIDTNDEELLSLVRDCTKSEDEKIRERAEEYFKRREKQLGTIMK